LFFTLLRWVAGDGQVPWLCCLIPRILSKRMGVSVLLYYMWRISIKVLHASYIKYPLSIGYFLSLPEK